jgi:transcriptional regulator with XRE-family HTH domain
MDPGNNLRQVREARMLSKAELARPAGISPLTIDRIEKGMPCRIATRRKILLLWDSNFLSGEEFLGRDEAHTILSPIRGLDANVLECIRTHNHKCRE